MKKISIIILSFLILVVIISCSKKDNDKNRNVSKIGLSDDFVGNIVKQPFRTRSIKSDKAKKIIKDFFKNNNYKVIFDLPIGYKNKKIYFAVEEYRPDLLYNCIKKGIMVSEDGIIKAIFNTKIGIFNPKYKNNPILNLKKIGFYKDEIKYFILGFNFESLKKYSKCKSNKINTTGIDIILLDKDFNTFFKPNNIKNMFNFHATLEVRKERVDGGMILFLGDLTVGSEKEYYKNLNYHLKGYRKLKAEGEAYKSPAVKKVFRKLVKEGRVFNYTEKDVEKEIKNGR